MSRVVRKGRFFRYEDSKWIPRYRCTRCGRSFSSSRLTSSFRQKRRRLNSAIQLLFCSGVSQRRISRLLQTNRKTVARKLLFLAQEAKRERLKELKRLALHSEKIFQIQFDEMESFERSKCLPLSIPLVVETGTRKILNFRVASMPAKGLLSQISRKKYGFRKDERPQKVSELLKEVKPVISSEALILTDQNPRYPLWLKRHFPKATHKTVKGRRGCIVGQGELKKIGFDPLFDLNHTCAMIRANVNRLFRRTWCTTKRADRLMAHLEVYVQYHNQVLTATA